MADITVSGTTNAYVGATYAATSNDRNTLDISDYFQLLAAQLANQDMTDPMSSSEMMSEMVQMAMVQSISSMTEVMENTQALNTQTYAAGLIGQQVTVAVTENGTATGVKYGKVVSVNFTSSEPTIRIEGDNTEYKLSYVLGMGTISDPFSDTTTGDATESGSAGTVEGTTKADKDAADDQTKTEDTTTTEDAAEAAE